MHVRTQRTDRIELDALVFAWPENLQDLKAPEFLVNAFAAPGTSLEDVVARFLERVCPDGVPGTLIVSNAAHEVDRPSWDRQLLFRPVCEGPLAEELGRNGYTLGLRVFRHQGRLAISRLEVTPHVPKRDFEVEVTGVIHWLSSSDFMSAEDFDRLAHLPERRAETRKRLTSWRTYLAWREKLIHDNQVSIPFVAFRWTSDDRIVFLVDEPLPTNRKLVGLEIGFTEATEASEARPPKLTKLGTIRSMDEVGRGSKSAPNAWTPSGTEPVAGQTCVVVQVEDDVAALHAREIPARGLLMSTISGDLAPLHNQSVGMDRLQRDQSFSPRLGDVLFSASGASVPASLPEGLPHVEGGRDLNEGQQEAVIKALAAPDLCLTHFRHFARGPRWAS
ncbi:MAG: hypothetical protein IT385_01620 [Deltaproteobacteria bacterium]|nr:hypothetical protein [Deltaproteobacteria bacterium]